MQLTPYPLISWTSIWYVNSHGRLRKITLLKTEESSSLTEISYDESPHKLLKTELFWNGNPLILYTKGDVPPNVLKDNSPSQYPLQLTSEVIVIDPETPTGSVNTIVSMVWHKFASW